LISLAWPKSGDFGYDYNDYDSGVPGPLSIGYLATRALLFKPIHLWNWD